MASIDQLHAALIGADAAGDTEAATALATEIKRMSAPVEKPDMYKQTAENDSNSTNLLAAIGGAMKAPYLGVKQMLGKTDPGEIDDYKRSMEGLWSTPMGKVGTVAGGVAAGAPIAMLPGANTAVGAALGGAAFGGIQPVGEGESRLANTGLGAAGGVAGKYIGEGIGKAASSLMANRASSLAAQESNNAVRDATIGTAREAGYVFPPSQINPSTPNRLLEGFAGKLTTAQNASAKNQSVTNTLIKREIGLPPEAPLSLDSIRAARSEAAKAYEPVRSFGTVEADGPYAQALDDIATKYDKSHGGMNSLRNKEVEGLLQDASKLQLDSNNAVELLRNLREQGFANASPLAKGSDRVVGKTQLSVANAVEDLLDRRLAEAGQPEVLQAFRDARVRIAKTFTAEKALNPATGNIDASKIAAMFRKDKPLTGGFETVGRTAAAFPKATAEIKTSLPQLSPLDYMGGMLAGGAAGPGAALGMFARPVARSGILSQAYQKAMVNPPSYEMGLLARNAGKLDKESTRALLRSLGMSLPADQ